MQSQRIMKNLKTLNKSENIISLKARNIMEFKKKIDKKTLVDG